MRKIPLAAFLIPFLLLLLSFRLVVFDADFYKSEFEKYNIYDRFDKSVADSAVTNLIDYMKSGVPLSDFFNEKEKAHMVDVRNIIQKFLVLLYVLAFVVVTLLAYNRKNLFKSLFYDGIFTLIILLLFFILSYTFFDFIFHKFHELSFSNDFWMLNPEVDNLKALLPDGFFYDALMRIFFIALASSVVITLLGFSSEKVLNILKHHFYNKNG
jgi:integral membrane protein (TIGR01906 family)